MNHSDASDILIEVFTNLVTIFADVCRLFTIHTMWIVVVRSTLSVNE